MNRYMILLIGVIASPCVTFAQEPVGKKVALLVGVQKYSEGSGLRNLDYSEKDVSDLAAVLDKIGYQVTLLTRSEAIKQDKDFLRPTAKNIQAHIRSLTADRKLADTVLLAFTGHGVHLKKTNKLYFCPSETDLSDEQTLLAIDEVMASLSREKCRAASKILLMDACRNDPADGRGTGTPKELQSATRPLLPEPPGGTVALFSCSTGQMSHESATFKRGYLFHHVIEGLSGKAASQKTGEITWLGLTNYVCEELPDSVRKDKGPNVRQTPEVKGESRALTLAKLDLASITGEAAIRMEDFVWKGEKRQRAVRVIKIGDIDMEFVKVDGGREFTTGLVRFKYDSPVWIAKYPMTVAQFRSFVNATQYVTSAELNKEGGEGFSKGEFMKSKDFSWRNTGWEQSEQYPVVNVSMQDAIRYCEYAGKKTPHQFRPIDSFDYSYVTDEFRGEFESLDNVKMKGFGNFYDRTAFKLYPSENTDPKTLIDDRYPFSCEVGKFLPNKYGLYDVVGNVGHWLVNTGFEFDEKKHKDKVIVNPVGNPMARKALDIRNSDADGVSFKMRYGFCISSIIHYRADLGIRIVLLP